MQIDGGGRADSRYEIAWRLTARSEGPYQRYVKPILDVACGAILLLITLPILLIVLLVVLVTMGRPVIYSQSRVGLNGTVFRLYKVRTMAPDRRMSQREFEGHDRRRAHKSPQDPRVGSVGRFLRRSRIDELPQLLNVLKGDMSLVGPRPELPEIVASYEPWQHQRHAVKPGLTGLWQVSDQNGTPMHECTELDLEYIEKLSFTEDLRIILRTPQTMLGRRRGY